MLHGIHSVFPPPDSGKPEDDPVSFKKLLAGDGIWAVRKEVLGWIFDGILRTMELPPEKVTRLLGSLSHDSSAPCLTPSPRNGSLSRSSAAFSASSNTPRWPCRLARAS
jgi:hypothetical protein